MSQGNRRGGGSTAAEQSNQEEKVMKMFFIVYSWGIDEEVIDALAKSGVNAYTKWTKVMGCGSETEPKLGSQIWPGENDVLTVVVNNEDAFKVKAVTLNLRKQHPRAGIRCFILPVEEMI
jgi:nitrogen regulatory protein PII